jgi:low affinity Fe/Cu permease
MIYGVSPPRGRHHEIFTILPIAFSLGWEFENLWYRHRTDHRVGVHGALFHYNDTWQLIMNSSTTIITFPMVFLIQTLKTVTTTFCI